jgi:hypothetical protein
LPSKKGPLLSTAAANNLYWLFAAAYLPAMPPEVFRLQNHLKLEVPWKIQPSVIDIKKKNSNGQPKTAPCSPLVFYRRKLENGRFLFL